MLIAGGTGVVVSTAAFHARVQGSVPDLGGLKDRQGSNFESCVWRTVSNNSSHHPQKVLLAQFSLYLHKGGLKPDLFHFISETVLVSCGTCFFFNSLENGIILSTEFWSFRSPF